ncbi:MAG: hypothetical protein GKR99_08235 [Rhodobacteraceae bacterium]|nr:hypothetical protein [Paracoccaceae bacterium]
MQLNHCQSMSRHNSGFPHVVAIDLPSGLDSETGHYPGYETEHFADSCPMANLTVTFHRLKPGHVLADGPAACGKVVVKDIGL